MFLQRKMVGGHLNIGFGHRQISAKHPEVLRGLRKNLQVVWIALATGCLNLNFVIARQNVSTIVIFIVRVKVMRWHMYIHSLLRCLKLHPCFYYSLSLHVFAKTMCL